MPGARNKSLISKVKALGLRRKTPNGNGKQQRKTLEDKEFDDALKNIEISEQNESDSDDDVFDENISNKDMDKSLDSGFASDDLDAELEKGDSDEENEEDEEYDGSDDDDEFDEEEGDDDEMKSSDDEEESEYESESEFDRDIKDTIAPFVVAKDIERKVKGFTVLRPKYPLQNITPEYDADSSDEETKNTVGKINMSVYNDLPHIGYDKFGNKIMKSEDSMEDALDKFLANTDNADTWRSVFNDLEGEKIKLSKEDLEMIQRIEQNKTAMGTPDTEAEEKAHADEFISDTMITPLSAAPEPKRRFIPSKHEASRIMKIVRGIRKGTISLEKPKKKNPNEVYNLWDNADEDPVERPLHIAAPKLRLPKHNESYNPPAEYLLTEAERKQWESLDPSERIEQFLPQKYQSLRSVPAYNRFIQERFDRCLDLYLSPRAIKMRMHVDPESLIPKLPDPKDLEPYPSSLAVVYKGHSKRIRSISVDPTGQWVASGSDDATVKIWEVSTGRCLRTYTLDEPVNFVCWNPNKTLGMLAAAYGENVVIFKPDVHNDEVNETTDILLSSMWNNIQPTYAKWERPTVEELSKNIAVHIVLAKTITHMSWHRKGDYFVTVSPDANSKAVLIHQISKQSTQAPFSKNKGLVQRVLFHPTQPLLYVATQDCVRIYDLVKQDLHKKLQSNAKWISSMDIHPGGDNVIIGTYDRKLCWFETDLSTKPYKTLRYHQFAIRDVAYHKSYPLFASCSDDGSINIFHGMVYNDLLQNPLIVPVKRIQAHENVGGIGALFCEFHPTQPWVFSSGADGLIKLFT